MKIDNYFLIKEENGFTVNLKENLYIIKISKSWKKKINTKGVFQFLYTSALLTVQFIEKMKTIILKCF